VRYTDQFFEELFNEFQKRNLIDETLFVFIGDHGEAFGEHTLKGHDNVLYEEGIHVAWVMYNRHLFPKPLLIKGLRQNIDLIPTLIDLLKLKVTQGEPWGISLLEPEKKVEDRVLHFACWWMDSCMGRLENNQKFIFQNGNSFPEFYELAADPLETHNLIRTVPRETVKKMAEDLINWKNDVNAVYDLSNWLSVSPYGSQKNLLVPKH